ncbi:MAG: hypothetical protein ACRDI2_25625, partial [Chloroflexota bacterium]
RDALRSDWAEMRTTAFGIAGTSHLDDLARAMVFMASGDEPHLAGLLERVGAASDDPVATDVVLPVINGLRAYRRGDFASAVDLIEPIAPSFGQLSEFTDQLSVLHDTLKDARTRALASAGTAYQPAADPAHHVRSFTIPGRASAG